MKALLCTVLLLPALCGCISAGKLARELAKDPATVSLRLSTPWGALDFVRLNPGTNTPAYTVARDGTVTVKAAAP